MQLKPQTYYSCSWKNPTLLGKEVTQRYKESLYKNCVLFSKIDTIFGLIIAA